MAKESPENRKEKGKTRKNKKRLFAYSFNIMDLEPDCTWALAHQ